MRGQAGTAGGSCPEVVTTELHTEETAHSTLPQVELPKITKNGGLKLAVMDSDRLLGRLINNICYFERHWQIIVSAD